MGNLIKMTRISLKNNPEINEDMIQQFIFDNPEVLGLGNLTAIKREKAQPYGGRLDLLLGDEDSTRYELEIQLDTRFTAQCVPSVLLTTGLVTVLPNIFSTMDISETDILLPTDIKVRQTQKYPKNSRKFNFSEGFTSLGNLFSASAITGSPIPYWHTAFIELLMISFSSTQGT